MLTRLDANTKELIAVHFDAKPFYDLVAKKPELQPKDDNLNDLLTNVSSIGYLQNKNYNHSVWLDSFPKTGRSLGDPIFLSGKGEMLIPKIGYDFFQDILKSSEHHLEEFHVGSSMIKVNPDVIKMEKLFGIKTSLFNDVTRLNETLPIVLKRFLVTPGQFDKFQKLFTIHRFKLTELDFHNLYYIATRFREKRDVNGRVSIKNGRFVAEHDASMRAAYVKYQDETIVILGSGKAKRSNPSGARYKVFDELMLKTIPWFAAEFGLMQNRARHLFILLLIAAEYEDLRDYFEFWKLKKERPNAVFDPYNVPLEIDFLRYFEGNLKPKDEAKRLIPFLRELKINPDLKVNDRIVPAFIKENIIDEIEARNFSQEEITNIKLAYKRYEPRCRSLGIWLD